ncbi:hypothetical protein OAK75_00100 [Bacteriovoracales bacterium]|nr:hypothetical protein [Bacteriovoracales bacterium]
MFTLKHKFPLFILCFIIFSGIFARLSLLDNHFPNNDDLGVAFHIKYGKKRFDYQKSEIGQKQWEITRKASASVKNYIQFFSTVPDYWSMAPLQYYLTSLLLIKPHNYRETLFWGRLPSFLLGCLGLFIFPLFLFHFNSGSFKEKFILSLYGTTIITFSWSNIIFSVQALNYAFGVLSSILILILLWRQLTEGENWKNNNLHVTMAILLALLSHAHYQVLFLLPSIYLTYYLFVARQYISNRKDTPRFSLKVLRRGKFNLTLKYHLAYYFFALKQYTFNRREALSFSLKVFRGGILYLILIYPLKYNLIRLSEYGLNSNTGRNNEYLFDNSLQSLKSLYPIKFFFFNFIDVFNYNLYFSNNYPNISNIFSVIFFLFFVLGCFSLYRSEDLRKRYFLLFFIFASITWIALVIFQKIAFSPTRHSLILLPFFTLLMAEGAVSFYRLRLSPILHFIKTTFLFSLIIAIVGVFFLSYHDHSKERQDPFVEKDLIKIFRANNIKSVFEFRSTMQLSFMNKLNKEFPVLTEMQVPKSYEKFRQKWSSKPKPKYFTKFAMISNQSIPTKDDFLRFKNLSNGEEVTRDTFLTTFKDYKLVKSLSIVSDTPLEFNDKTRWDKNHRFIKIYELK